MDKFRMIVEGGVYAWASSKEFGLVALKGLARCLKANVHDSSVLLKYENDNLTS